MRDSDAILGEIMSDAELDAARDAGMQHPCGILPCDECETTGVVSEPRLQILQAEAREAVRKILAREATGE